MLTLVNVFMNLYNYQHYYFFYASHNALLPNKTKDIWKVIA